MVFSFICIYSCSLLIATIAIIKANSHKITFQETKKDTSLQLGYRLSLRVLYHLQDLEEEE